MSETLCFMAGRLCRAAATVLHVSVARLRSGVRPQHARAGGGGAHRLDVDVDARQRDAESRPLAGERQPPRRRGPPDPDVVAPEAAAAAPAEVPPDRARGRLVCALAAGEDVEA